MFDCVESSNRHNNCEVATSLYFSCMSDLLVRLFPRVESLVCILVLETQNRLVQWQTERVVRPGSTTKTYLTLTLLATPHFLQAILLHHGIRPASFVFDAMRIHARTRVLIQFVCFY